MPRSLNQIHASAEPKNYFRAHIFLAARARLSRTFVGDASLGRPMFQNIKLDLSDHFIAEIAVVDQSGAIVHCNRKWNETAKIGALGFKPTGWNIEEWQPRSCAAAPTLS